MGLSRLRDRTAPADGQAARLRWLENRCLALEAQGALMQSAILSLADEVASLNARLAERET